MSEEDRAHVGDRFRRGKDARPGGAGLGLAIVKTIAELHGGTLSVEDGPDHIGITMQLILPLQKN
jgi:signal transduction histidine kinase